MRALDSSARKVRCLYTRIVPRGNQVRENWEEANGSEGGIGIGGRNGGGNGAGGGNGSVNGDGDGAETGTGMKANE